MSQYYVELSFQALFFFDQEKFCLENQRNSFLKYKQTCFVCIFFPRQRKITCRFLKFLCLSPHFPSCSTTLTVCNLLVGLIPWASFVPAMPPHSAIYSFPSAWTSLHGPVRPLGGFSPECLFWINHCCNSNVTSTSGCVFIHFYCSSVSENKCDAVFYSISNTQRSSEERSGRLSKSSENSVLW